MILDKEDATFILQLVAMIQLYQVVSLAQQEYNRSANINVFTHNVKIKFCFFLMNQKNIFQILQTLFFE